MNIMKISISQQTPFILLSIWTLARRGRRLLLDAFEVPADAIFETLALPER